MDPEEEQEEEEEKSSSSEEEEELEEDDKPDYDPWILTTWILTKLRSQQWKNGNSF